MQLKCIGRTVTTALHLSASPTMRFHQRSTTSVIPFFFNTWRGFLGCFSEVVCELEWAHT